MTLLPFIDVAALAQAARQHRTERGVVIFAASLRSSRIGTMLCRSESLTLGSSASRECGFKPCFILVKEDETCEECIP